VPRDRAAAEPPRLADEWRAVLRAPVLLGLATTVLGFAGVFAVFTYIAPLLTRVSGFADSAVSPILLVFGGGLMAGNLIGGRLADRRLVPAMIGSLVVLAVVLVALTFALPHRIAAVFFVGLFGAAAFATVPPLQMWVLEKASGAGRNLASSLNIAAFNLGNAIGAWLGGVVIDQGPGLAALGWTAALLPLSALAVIAWSVARERAAPRATVAACAE